MSVIHMIKFPLTVLCMVSFVFEQLNLVNKNEHKKILKEFSK